MEFLRQPARDFSRGRVIFLEYDPSTEGLAEEFPKWAGSGRAPSVEPRPSQQAPVLRRAYGVDREEGEADEREGRREGQKRPA